MLIDFSVANFRSFASAQRLSLSAGRFNSDRVGSIQNTASKTAPHLLRVAAIMGANGAGKSNLIKALEFFQQFVAMSAQSMQRGDKIDVVPFRLDNEFSEKASAFEISFVYENVEYHYNFSVNRKEVVSEVLLSRTKDRTLKEVFSRQLNIDGNAWNLGSLPKAQARLWRQSTRPNALFLSTAVQLNSDDLAKPFEWLTKRLRVQTSDDPFSPSLTSHLIKDHVSDGCRTAIFNLLREADLGIRNVVVEEEDFDESSLPADMPDEIKSNLSADLKGKKFLSAKFEHRTKQMNTILFDYDEESEGTQRLFEIAGPWITSLRHDYTLVVDEIENSLHPFLVRLLVQMFQTPEREDGRAQLIFSTHNDGVLDAGVLERDQFWFVEKRRGQSELIPLIDYKPRKGEAVRSNYLKGRYGGVPAIAHVSR